MREWIVRIALLLLGMGAMTVVLTSGCSQKLGTLDIKTDGEFSGLMYKNCGCGCTAIVDVNSDESLDAGGKEPIGSNANIGVNVSLPKK